jgi:hypothetical protein
MGYFVPATEPLPGATKRVLAATGVMILFGVSAAVAQIGGQTGTVPGFPQFYESSSERTCEGGNVCELNFGLVPANRLLMATDIMCHAFASEDVPIRTRARFRLREEKSGDETQKNVFSVEDISPPSSVVQREYILTASIRSFFAGESRPTISFSPGGLPGSLEVACKLSGDLVASE